MTANTHVVSQPVDPQGAVQGGIGTQTRRSAFGRPEVDPQGAVQGGIGTQSAAGDFFQ
jgi:hypothetical protein